jgi:hypothetical protein
VVIMKTTTKPSIPTNIDLSKLAAVTGGCAACGNPAHGKKQSQGAGAGGQGEGQGQE